MLIDAHLYNQDSEPRAWLISKINRISPDGIARVTLAQDIFDPHNDYIERDTDGRIIGMWANYYNSNITPSFVPEDDPSPTITSRITCTGKPQFKVGGSAKTFTVTYYGDDDSQIDTITSENWSFIMDGEQVPSDLLDTTISGNSIKVKFLGDDSYIGKLLTITNTFEEITSSMEVEVIPL